MEFVFNGSKKFDATKKDWEFLREDLMKEADKINYSFGKLFFQQRVYFDVWPAFLLTNEEVKARGENPEDFVKNPESFIEIQVGFKKEDLEKRPSKYGETFRNRCLILAKERAEEILGEETKGIIIVIREDAKVIEKCNYKKRAEDSKNDAVCTAKKS